MRQASKQDIPAISRMADTVFRLTYKEILSPEQMEYMMDMMYSDESLNRQMGELGHVFLIEDGKGYVSFHRDGRTEDGRERFHLEKLYVMPEWQKTGLGRKMFEAVCDYVRSISTGSPRIELNVNRHNPAVPFYEHLGMFKARQGDFPIGNGFYMNDYIMAIDL